MYPSGQYPNVAQNAEHSYRGVSDRCRDRQSRPGIVTAFNRSVDVPWRMVPLPYTGYMHLASCSIVYQIPPLG
jgi:hypothetical protein